MIRINLLPAEMTKRPGASGPRFRLPKGGLWPYMLPLFLVVAGIGYAAYYMYSMEQKALARLEESHKNKTRLDKELKKRQADFDENNAASQEIEQKWQVAQALMNPTNRLFWSEKLNMIAKARMDLAVFITKITLDETITEEETEESKQARADWAKTQGKEGTGKKPEPQKIMSPVINQTLTIHAIAYGNDSPQRLRQMNAFESALRNLTWKRQSGSEVRFTDNLDPQFGILPQSVMSVGGIEVLKFGIVCNALAQKPKARTTPAPAPGGKDAAAPAPAPAPARSSRRGASK